MGPREIEGRGHYRAGRCISGCLLALATALLAPLILVGGASANPAPEAQHSPAQITEFPLPSVDFPGAIAAGSDGKMWFANSQGNGVLPAYEEKYTYGIDNITSSGQITEFKAPTSGAGELAAGPDGNIWYLGEDKIGRITPTGQVTEFRGGTALSRRADHRRSRWEPLGYKERRQWDRHDHPRHAQRANIRIPDSSPRIWPKRNHSRRGRKRLVYRVFRRPNRSDHSERPNH